MPHHRAQTVVITGASSGIGRAAALEFARRGYALALTARRGAALEELATECRGLGAQVMVEPADVTDADALARIAQQVVSTHGWLDVWINNAATVSYGRTEEMPLELWRRVVEVNLVGYYHGIRAALPWFREQGAGVLINVSSMLGKTPAPYQSAYVVSKYGVRALSDCVRQEVQDVKGISVCTVLPGAIDTPLFRSGANVTGYQIRPPGPPIDARRVASALVRCARRPRPEVPVGASTRAGLLAAWLLPGVTERTFKRMVDAAHFTDEPAAWTEGNLFTPAETGARIDDGWREPNGWRPPNGRFRTAAKIGAAAAVATAAGVIAARARNRGR